MASSPRDRRHEAATRNVVENVDIVTVAESSDRISERVRNNGGYSISETWRWRTRPANEDTEDPYVRRTTKRRKWRAVRPLAGQAGMRVGKGSGRRKKLSRALGETDGRVVGADWKTGGDTDGARSPAALGGGWPGAEEEGEAVEAARCSAGTQDQSRGERPRFRLVCSPISSSHPYALVLSPSEAEPRENARSAASADTESAPVKKKREKTGIRARAFRVSRRKARFRSVRFLAPSLPSPLLRGLTSSTRTSFRLSCPFSSSLRRFLPRRRRV